MSLNKDPKLREIIKERCRELRKKSTNAERIFWEQVRNKKFYVIKFYRQFPILHDVTGKETFFILDFYCHQANLAVEIDGGIHKRLIKADRLKDKVLKSLGIRVIRFQSREIEEEINKVMKKLEEFII